MNLQGRVGRNKVKLQYIENDTSRKTTFTKRVRGVVRKTQELSVMCGVDAVAVIYGPYSQSPVVWPSSEAEAKRILSSFRRKPEVDQSQRQFDQVAFLKESVAKAQEKLQRLQRRNREMEMENIITEVIHGRMTFEQVPHSDLGDLLWVIEDKLRSIDQRQNLANCLPPRAKNNLVPVQGNGAGASSSSSCIPEDLGLSAIVNQSLTINEPQVQAQAQAQTQAQAQVQAQARAKARAQFQAQAQAMANIQAQAQAKAKAMAEAQAQARMQQTGSSSRN